MLARWEREGVGSGGGVGGGCGGGRRVGRGCVEVGCGGLRWVQVGREGGGKGGENLRSCVANHLFNRFTWFPQGLAPPPLPLLLPLPTSFSTPGLVYPKVCLSLLGTWSGSPEMMWSPDASLLQVLLSIQVRG